MDDEYVLFIESLVRIARRNPTQVKEECLEVISSYRNRYTSEMGAIGNIYLKVFLAQRSSLEGNERRMIEALVNLMSVYEDYQDPSEVEIMRMKLQIREHNTML